MAHTTQTCTECRTPFEAFEMGGQPLATVCAVCVKIGPRSLLRLQALLREANTDEERTAIMDEFHAAKGRADTSFQAGREMLKRR